MDSARYLLVFGVILTLLCGIVPVSAGEIIHDETFSVDVYKTATYKGALSWGGATPKTVHGFAINSGFNQQPFVYINDYPSSSIENYNDLPQSGAVPINYHIYSNRVYLDIIGTGTFSYFKFTVGENRYLRLQFETGGLELTTTSAFVGVQAQPDYELPLVKIDCDGYGQSAATILYKVIVDGELPKIWPVTFSPGSDNVMPIANPASSMVVVNAQWKNRLFIEEFNEYCDITIFRNLAGAVQSRVEINSAGIVIDEASFDTKIYRVWQHEYPFDIRITSDYHNQTFFRNFMVDATPTPTPIPEPELTYIAKIEARDYHTNEILPDVHFLVVDFPKYEIPGQSPTLYSDWVSSGILEIPLEYRAYDDPNFPRQYGIRASKQGYYSDDIIVSHWTGPYTFIIRMRDIYSEEPLDTSLITFHIRDRFSNNYIDTAQLIITHYNDGEVYNQTVKGGIQTVRLPQTQPYDPQFDYNATVKADNYDDTVMGFSVYNDVDINIKMFPGEGTPGEGNAFIHFTVGYFDNNDIFRNIPGAKITIGAQSMYTNAAGYAQFELPDDNFYTYTAEHFEFETVSGSIMLQGSRTHNIIMHRHEVPTTPTAQPTFPGEEPADESYLDWMARNFARAFNLSLEGGKLFMGMIISLAIGMITAKKLNGGAAEFGIGMLGGMVLCILIGILPIWPIIALLLIVGLYIGMHIARGYTHGGR